jgi:hypothetical protein
MFGHVSAFGNIKHVVSFILNLTFKKLIYEQIFVIYFKCVLVSVFSLTELLIKDMY